MQAIFREDSIPSAAVKLCQSSIIYPHSSVSAFEGMNLTLKDICFMFEDGHFYKQLTVLDCHDLKYEIILIR